jgi:aminoglycoside phosphotransferase
MTTILRNPNTLLEPVRRELSAVGFPVTCLSLFASGLEFAVFRGRRGPDHVVVKTPWQRHIANDNDADQDARDLLRQESALLQFARLIRIPTPEVCLLHVEGALDLLVTTLLPHDGSAPDGEELATILAALHSASPPAYPLVAQPGPFPAVVGERLGRRAGVVEKISGIRLGLPPSGELEAIIRASSAPASLLHLDVRPENVLVEKGRILGLVDWTNALVGDRALELARLAEYGTAPAGFAEAYQRRCPTATADALELIYRLDTAVMLAVVFLSEAPDRQQAAPRVARAGALAEALRDRLGR